MGKKTPEKKPFCFNFERSRRGFFISNFTGLNCFLSASDFSAFAKDGKTSRVAWRKLVDGGFFGNCMDLEKAVEIMRKKFFAGWKGPRVHIVCVGNRCNSFCGYCGAGSGPSGSVMNAETSDRVLDFAFAASPAELMLEFQGGEPLMNFKIVRRMVKEAKKRNRKAGKRLNFSIVTNLSLMDEGKLDFLVRNGVSVCASLDGPKELHDKNRSYPGGSSHDLTVKWLKKMVRLAGEGKMEMPNAICTVSKLSLKFPEEIVDEYAEIGLDRIQLGPLDKTGRAKVNWGGVGYSPGEFLEFYEKALERVFRLNEKEKTIYEKGARAFAGQILTAERPRYQNLDLLIRLAYDAGGGVYGSDEARMLSDCGDGTLRLGNVHEDSFADVLLAPAAKLLLLSDFNFLTQPKCFRCAWSPYCHITPALNLSSQNSLWGNMACNDRCGIYRGVFQMIRARMSKKRERGIFERWLSFCDI